MKTTVILSVPLHHLTMEEAVSYFIKKAQVSEQNSVATPNAEILLDAQKNQKLSTFLQQTTLNFPDSHSLLWAGAYLNNRWSRRRAIFELMFLSVRKSHWKNSFPEVITGSDSFLKICERAAEEGLKVFCLGGSGKSSYKNKLFVQTKFPSLSLDSHSGNGSIEGDPENLERINKCKPDILFIGYGCPKQEFWIKRNLPLCPSVKVAMGIGGTFDFYAGTVKRAPKFMRKLGLEWLYRLIRQPKRIGRIWNAVIKFPLAILIAGNKK